MRDERGILLKLNLISRFATKPNHEKISKWHDYGRLLSPAPLFPQGGLCPRRCRSEPDIRCSDVPWSSFKNSGCLWSPMTWCAGSHWTSASPNSTHLTTTKQRNSAGNQGEKIAWNTVADAQMTTVVYIKQATAECQWGCNQSCSPSRERGQTNTSLVTFTGWRINVDAQHHDLNIFVFNGCSSCFGEIPRWVTEQKLRYWQLAPWQLLTGLKFFEPRGLRTPRTSWLVMSDGQLCSLITRAKVEPEDLNFRMIHVSIRDIKVDTRILQQYWLNAICFTWDSTCRTAFIWLHHALKHQGLVRERSHALTRQ